MYQRRPMNKTPPHRDSITFEVLMAVCPMLGPRQVRAISLGKAFPFEREARGVVYPLDMKRAIIVLPVRDCRKIQGAATYRGSGGCCLCGVCTLSPDVFMKVLTSLPA